MAANHEATYTINATIHQLLAAIRDPAFCSRLNVSIQSESPTYNGVMFQFRHGVTFTSWGENVHITLTPVGPAVTNLQIRSECCMPTQIVDWGKNKQVVCNIYEYLVENVTRYPADAPQNMPPQYQPPAPQYQPAPQQPTSAPAFCCRCGNPLIPGGAFCSNCGTKVQ